jgi:hypothetical protein
MKHYVWRLLVVFLLARDAIGAAAAPVELDPSRPTFGKIERNSGVPAQLTVRAKNNSGSLLVLDRVEVGCGCVQAAITGPREIPPGEATTISVNLRMDAIRKGEYEYPLSLISNNIRIASTTVTYEYAPRIEVEPKSLNLGIHTDSTDTSIACEILEHMPGSLAQTRAIASQPWLEVEIDQQNRNSLRLMVPRTRPFGIVNERIVLQSTTGQVEQIVPVTGEFRAPVVLQPDILLLTDVAPNATMHRTVNLVASGNYRLKKIETSAPNVTVQPGRIAGEYEILFQRTASTSADVAEATVEFFFDDPREFSLVLPVVAEYK